MNTEQDYLKKLSDPLLIQDIDFRVQSINKGGYATILAYKEIIEIVLFQFGILKISNGFLKKIQERKVWLILKKVWQVIVLNVLVLILELELNYTIIL